MFQERFDIIRSLNRNQLRLFEIIRLRPLSKDRMRECLQEAVDAGCAHISGSVTANPEQRQTALEIFTKETTVLFQLLTS